MKERWWTAPAIAESGRTFLVTGRDYMDEVIAKNKYVNRITVSLDYDALPTGMPSDNDAELMQQVTDAFMSAFKRDKVAYLTGIYTGDGKREWVFYTSNLFIFQKVFNRALENLPLIPLVIEAEADPEWNEYREMREISYIAEDENEI